MNNSKLNIEIRLISRDNGFTLSASQPFYYGDDRLAIDSVYTNNLDASNALKQIVTDIIGSLRIDSRLDGK